MKYFNNFRVLQNAPELGIQSVIAHLESVDDVVAFDCRKLHQREHRTHLANLVILKIDAEHVVFAESQHNFPHCFFQLLGSADPLEFGLLNAPINVIVVCLELAGCLETANCCKFFCPGKILEAVGVADSKVFQFKNLMV